MDDVAVSKLWLSSNMTRKAAWASNNVIIDMLSDLVGPDPIGRSTIPSSCCTRPIAGNEFRDVRDGDGAYVVHSCTGEETPVLPTAFDVRELLVVNHLIDRCSIGGTGIWFCVFALNLAWSVNWGVAHDAWNSIKNGSKKTGDGAGWRSVVRFAAVANLRYGPRRSGVWGTKMKQTHASLVERWHARHPRFMAAAEAQEQLEPGRFGGGGACPYDAWWDLFGSLPSCTSTDAAVVKFSRWMSINDVWAKFRGEWFLLKPVLEEMAGDADPGFEAFLDGMTDRWDDQPRLAAPDDDHAKGLIAKAPSYISFNVAQGMDIFALASYGLREDYSHRTTRVNTVADHFENLKAGADGNWTKVIRSTVEQAWYRPCELVSVCPEGFPERRAVGIQLLFENTVYTCAEWILREVPRYGSYPNAAVGVCREGDEGQHGHKTLVDHYNIILKAELNAQSHPDTAIILKDIFWMRQPSVRLLFATAERDFLRHDQPVQTRWLTEALVGRLDSEKPAEDYHQHVRDAQRCRRDRRISLSAIYAILQRSGVLEARGLPSLVVANETLARRSWWESARKKTQAARGPEEGGAEAHAIAQQDLRQRLQVSSTCGYDCFQRNDVLVLVVASGCSRRCGESKFEHVLGQSFIVSV